MYQVPKEPHPQTGAEGGIPLPLEATGLLEMLVEIIRIFMNSVTNRSAYLLLVWSTETHQ
jgi:hypothetical protein